MYVARVPRGKKRCDWQILQTTFIYLNHLYAHIFKFKSFTDHLSAEVVKVANKDLKAYNIAYMSLKDIKTAESRKLVNTSASSFAESLRVK